MEFNKYQTPLTDELLLSLTQEEQTDLLDYLNNVPFIRALVDPDRKYAKDLPRDEKGRIIVDLTQPHILENMDYFRQVGKHFEEHGCFTKLRPNGNPNSEYGKWYRRELKRCWHGMVRPSDGEWIPGKLYFYWNYTPITISKIIPGTKIADRVAAFPEIWELTYLWAHYEDQARFGGKYDHFVGGKDAGIISRRGAGKSFYKASNMARLFTVGASSYVKKDVRGVLVAYEKEYLNRDGTLNKFVSMIDFLADNTQWPSTRHRNSLIEMNWLMGYQDADSGVIKGTKNEILGISAKDNPDKVRGKRSVELVYEEFGVFPKFIDTWTTSEYNVREGEFAFGQRAFIGTGGTEGSDFQGAAEILNSPEAHRVYALPNVFDKSAAGRAKTILFLGGYLNRKGFYTQDGVSDVVGAMISILKDRTSAKYNSTNPTLITRVKAEMPIVLQEAILKVDSTIYPVSELNDAIMNIDADPTFWGKLWIGRLGQQDGKVVYVPDPTKEVIKDFPHKDNKLEGAICISALPVCDSSGIPPRGRYIAGLDPIDDDESTTLSLFSLYILDLFTDELVFEYTGRPSLADDGYEICRKALLMYNAECNYENNKKGLFKYFSQHNALYLLSDTLEFLKDKEEGRPTYLTNKSKGTHALASVNSYARRLIRDWLLVPTIISKPSTTEPGEVVQMDSFSLHKIPFRALLRELALWNPDGNFDRHAALGMLMLLREDKLRKLGTREKDSVVQQADMDYLGNDDYFTRNYKE